jgi:hypothetical protein
MVITSCSLYFDPRHEKADSGFPHRSCLEISPATGPVMQNGTLPLSPVMQAKKYRRIDKKTLIIIPNGVCYNEMYIYICTHVYS